MSLALIPPRPRRPRRDLDMYDIENALRHSGFDYVAGCDEAGRGACAGPLVVAAVVLPPGSAGRVPELADSKLLTALARQRVYQEVMSRALASAIVVIDAGSVDRHGVGFCNLSGMRRAVAQLEPVPHYVLTDGFPVKGLIAPGLGVIKGDQVSASVAAASVLAKVTRDRIMMDLHQQFPDFGFDEHKGYSTPTHQAALSTHGPCSQHRRSYANVMETDRGRTLGVASADIVPTGAHDG